MYFSKHVYWFKRILLYIQYTKDSSTSSGKLLGFYHYTSKRIYQEKALKRYCIWYFYNSFLEDEPIYIDYKSVFNRLLCTFKVVI